jgi:putative acetyltransferase
MPLLRPESPVDIVAIDRIHELAFGRPDEARLVAALRLTDAYIPEVSLVAADQTEVVGHILLTRILIRSADSVTPALALAPLAVLPDFQRRGIGSALVQHGLDTACQLGHAIVVVLGHAGYYPRFGFEPAHPYGIGAPFAVRSDSWMVRELVPGALRGVCGMVQYAAPFMEVR